MAIEKVVSVEGLMTTQADMNDTTVPDTTATPTNPTPEPIAETVVPEAQADTTAPDVQPTVQPTVTPQDLFDIAATGERVAITPRDKMVEEIQVREKQLANDPNTNTVDAAMRKYVNPNMPKATLLDMLDKNPESATALLSTGAITASDIESVLRSKNLSEAQQRVEALQSAWIKAPEDSILGTVVNSVLQGVSAGTSALLAIPDSAVTLHTALTVEPKNDTDSAYQSWLLGREKLRELDETRNDASQTKQARTEADYAYKELAPNLSALYDQVAESPDFERTREKHISGYYTDMATNFMGKSRKAITGIANHENINAFAESMGRAFDGNVELFADAKASLDEGNILAATGKFLAGSIGLSADAVEAIVQNPVGLLDVMAQSFGYMGAGGAYGKALGMGTSLLTKSAGTISAAEFLGATAMYQGMYSAEAYADFEQTYGHLPQGDQLAILNGVAAVAGVISVGGDKFMMASLEKLKLKPSQIQSNAFRDVLASPLESQRGAIAGAIGGIVGSRAAMGTAVETVQEFVEALVVSYAGKQDLDKVDLRQATIEALMASGAGTVIGGLGDFGAGLRSLRTGAMEERFASARAGYTVTRSDITDIPSAQATLTETLKTVNQAFGSMERDEAGGVTKTQANAAIMGSIYDAVIRDIAGLDAVFAGLPISEGFSVRADIEQDIRSGRPLKDVINDVTEGISAFDNPVVVLQQLAENNPEIAAVAAPILSGEVTPDNFNAAQASLWKDATDIAGITTQVKQTAKQVNDLLSIDTFVAEVDTTRVADKKAQKAKTKEAKAKAKEAKETGTDEQGKAVANKDTAEVKAQSKFTAAEIISRFDSSLTPAVEAEVTVDETPTVEVTPEEETAAQAELQAAQVTQPDKQLNSPTATQGASTIAEAEPALATLSAKFNAAPNKVAEVAFVDQLTTLAKQLVPLSNKKSLTDADKATATEITSVLARYIDSFGANPNTNSATLGRMLKAGVKFVDVQKALETLGVPKSVNLFTRINSAARGGVDTTVEPSTTEQPTSTAIDRPATSTMQLQRYGQHSTPDLINIAPRGLTVLNDMLSNILKGNVKGIAPDFVTDVLSILGQNAQQLDTLFNAMTDSQATYETQAKATFTDVRSKTISEQSAQKAYVAMAEYFQRVDPQGRDLTFLLSKHIPEVRQALDTILKANPAPSEFTKLPNQQKREQVYEPVTENPAEVPTDLTAQTAMVLDGIYAIQSAGLDAGRAYTEQLVNEEGLARDGNIVKLIQGLLTNQFTDDMAIPAVLVNPTRIISLNRFINAQAVPNKAVTTNREVPATWTGNVNMVVEAFNRLRLGSDALSMFKVSPLTKGGMYEVFNIFSVLEDKTSANYVNVASNFTPDELAQIETVLPYIQSMRNMLAHMYTDIPQVQPYMLNNLAMNLFETMQTSGNSKNADNYMHPNFSAIIAQTALEYAFGDGIQMFGYNNQDSFEKLVNEKDAHIQELRNALHSGSLVKSIAPRLGATIRKRLGILPDANLATSDQVGQLENSLGHMALALLMNQGIIEPYTVGIYRDYKGDYSHVMTKEGLTWMPNVASGNDVLQMVRFNETKLAQLDHEHDSAMNALTFTKSLTEKLYGKEDKLAIATTPDDVKTQGANTELGKVAKEMSAKSPQVLHRGKYTLFSNLGRVLQETLFKGNLDVSKVHSTRTKVVEALNRKAKADLARIERTVAELDEAGTDTVYLHQIVGENARMTGVNPLGADPVNMSPARFLFNVEADSVVTFGEDSAAEYMFYRGMVQAMGGKPEEMSNAQVKAAFDALANNDSVQEAVALVNQGKVTPLTDTESARLGDILTGLKWESMHNAIDAVYAYSNYIAAKTDGVFSVDVPLFMEMDGKNNGSALGVLQNAPISDLTDFIRMTQSVGINFSEAVMTYAELKANDPNFLDAYQHLAKKVGEYGIDLITGDISDTEIRELLESSYDESITNRGELHNLLMKFLTDTAGVNEQGTLLDADGNVTKDGRSLFKQVLMTVLYGAGVITQDRYFANSIAAKHLDKMESFADQPATPELAQQVIAYFTDVARLGLRQSFRMPDTRQDNWNKALLNEEYAMTGASITMLNTLIANTIGVAYRKALDTPTYRGIITQAKSLAESANVAHIRLHFAAIKLLGKYKAEKGIGANTPLTVAQEGEFFTQYISGLITKFNYPLGLSDEALAGIKSVSVSSRKNARQSVPDSAFKAADAALKAAKDKDPEFKGTRDEFLEPKYREQMVREVFTQSEVNSMYSQVLKLILKSPALGTPASNIHAQDSSIQVAASKESDVPMLNLFDSRGGTVNTLTETDGAGNRALIKVQEGYNLYEDAANAYKETDTNLKSVLEASELAEVDTMVANALGLPDFKPSEYFDEINTAYAQIASRAKDVFGLVRNVDQYPMTADSVATKTPTPDVTLEALQEKYADSLDLDNLPSIAGNGLVTTGRNLALSTATVIETDTAILEEIIANDESLYSVNASNVGVYVNSVLREFASSLERFANAATNSGAAKALNEVATAVKGVRGNRMLNRALRLPTMDVNNLDAEILKLLMESNISDKSKQALARPEVQALLRGASPEAVAARQYVTSASSKQSASTYLVNYWLAQGDNLKWLNAKPNELLSDKLVDALRNTKMFGSELSAAQLIQALLLSPNSASYIGKEQNGKVRVKTAATIQYAIERMSAKQFMTMLMNSGAWGTTGSVTSMNTKLLAYMLYKGKVYTPALEELMSNPKAAKAYVDSITSRVLNHYTNIGLFDTGAWSPEAAQNYIRGNLLSPEQLTVTGTVENVVPVVASPEPKMSLNYRENQTVTMSYLGIDVDLKGDLKFTEDANLVHIIGKADVSHVFDATAGQLVGTQISENEAVIEPVLGTPTYAKANPSATYNDVSTDSLLSTYDDVVATSTQMDSAPHASQLRNLVQAMSYGLRDVTVRLAEVTNQVTSGFFRDRVVTVTLNKLLPKSVTNFMSTGETMAHELVHAITDNADEVSPTLSARMKELYKQAKRVVTWQDLLDPTLPPDDAEHVAKHLHNYMFASPVTRTEQTSVTTGVTKMKVESTRIAEFVALATTNENVGRALSKVMAQKAQYKGFTAKLIQLFSALSSMFFRKAHTGMKDASIQSELVDIIMQLSKLQNNHQSTLNKAVAKISDISNRTMNSTDTAFKSFLREVEGWQLEQVKDFKAVKLLNPITLAAVSTMPVTLFFGYDKIREKFRNRLRRLSAFRNQHIVDMVRDLTSASPDVHKIYDLIARRSQLIDTARNQIETDIAGYVNNNLFKNQMSQSVSHALTRAVLETDFNKLVQVFGADKAIDVLHIDNKRLHSLRKQYQDKLDGFKHRNYYINHAKALGELMAKGNTLYYGVHSNAYSIARLAGDNALGASPELESVDEITEIVDVLASLYAVMNIHPTQRMRARNFLWAEVSEMKEGEIKHAGLTGLLAIQSEAAETALTQNFYGNPQLMRKGYIREAFNPNVEIQIVEKTAIAEYQKQGFELVGGTLGSSEVPVGMDIGENKVMMVNRYSSSFNFDQGALSHTGFDKRGTSVGNMFNATNKTTPNVLTNRGKVTMELARKSMFTSNPYMADPSKSVGIAPTRNDQGDVVGYRYTMGIDAKENVLERESRVGHVLARTKSSVEDKVNSQAHNTVVLEELYKMYDEQYAKDPSKFVSIGLNSKNPDYVEMFRMLPAYSRAMISNMSQQRGLNEAEIMVPQELVTLVFGSAPMTLEKLNAQAEGAVTVLTMAITKILESKWGRIIGSAFKEAIASARDSMVIKSGTTTASNMVSNHYVLSIAGIPQSYIMRKYAQGTKEILRYQELSSHVRKLRTELAYTPMSDAKAATLSNLIDDAEAQMSSLSVTALIDEGLFQTIVEDVDSEIGKQAYQSEMSKVGDRLLAMTGAAETAIKEGVLVTHDSKSYRYLRDAAQLSDFVARYVMFSHMTENGNTVEEAVHKARETFILYDAPLSKPVKFANDIGLFNFAKFLMRTQGVLRHALRESPTRGIAYSWMWALMGASATIDVLITPFNFMGILMQRLNMNPLGFMANALEELPVFKVVL